MPMTHEVAQAEVADHAGVAFHPPVLLLLALSLGFGAKWLTPLPLLPDDVALPVGPVVVAASFGWFIWAVVTMRRAGGSIPTSEPTEAICQGQGFQDDLAVQLGVGGLIDLSHTPLADEGGHVVVGDARADVESHRLLLRCENRATAGLYGDVK